jgi:hypothetical protein
LDARAQYQTSKLAGLYDPLTLPAPLLKAHQQLDRAVDRCYRPEPSPSDRPRVEYVLAESNARDGSHGTICSDVFQQKT